MLLPILYAILGLYVTYLVILALKKYLRED